MDNKRIAAAIGVVILILLGIFFWYRSGGSGSRIVDLVETFPEAEKRANMALSDAFKIDAVTIGGDTKRAIAAHPTSRIVWRMKAPEHAGLRVWLGIREEAWDKSEDGVLFRIGVAAAKFEEPFKRHVDPKAVPGDRRWIPVDIDLSAYGGQDIELIFNTNSSLPGRGDNATYDWSVWGDPHFYAR